MTNARISETALKRLAEYWYRADLMHGLMHTMIEDLFDGDIDRINAEGYSWEFVTYLSYWLSGLFVVVEGFNKLKLKDARVQRLFNEHVSALKQLRHETYHFAVEKNPAATEVIRGLNWAEELHEAIGGHLRAVIKRKAAVERLMEIRLKTPRVG
jgi:hypothetical protein